MMKRRENTKQTKVTKQTKRRTLLVCFGIFVCFVFSLSSLAQRAKQQPKSRVYTIDTAQSRLIAHLTQEGLIVKRHPNHQVDVKTYTGKITVSTSDETQLRVEVEAESRSLTNIDKTMSDFERNGFHHVLRNEVLESEKFPTIKFTSVSVTDVERSGVDRKFTLNGDLLLHGTTRRVAVPVEAKFTDQELRATGEAKFKQSDFGIKPYEGGLGTIKIGDEVRVSFMVIARSSKE
jgi:polyisoprenoid-binding protein YceI